MMDGGDGLFHHSLPEKSCSQGACECYFPTDAWAHPIPKDCELNDLKHFSHSYSSNPPSSSGSVFLPKQSGPNWSDISKILSLPPHLSFSFFPCYSHLSISARGTSTIPYLSRLLSFEKTMKLLTPLGFHCYYTIIRL